MIIIEKVMIEDREFIHTYSDTYYIRKIGTDEVYYDAMDITEHEYEETGQLLVEPDE